MISTHSRIYLDYNATTPLHPELVAFATEMLLKFGNPSSVHGYGRESKKYLSQSREVISKYLNVSPLELIFTASGSESNNQAIKNTLPLTASERCEILYSSVEHPSVIKTIESLIPRGYKAIAIPVKRSGQIDLEFLKQKISLKTALVSVQLVNNETGNIFPIAEISKLAHTYGAIMHSDMVQALGKIKINLQELDVDLASFSAHKFNSLKGIGLLYVKKGININPLIHGGGQERGRRAGTENILAISTFGQAVNILGERVEAENKRIEILRDLIERELLTHYPRFQVNGFQSPRVSNTININCPGIDGETLLINLDTRGIAVSSGAACSSGTQEPSPVLRAMGLTHTEASQSMRITLGWMTTELEIKEFLEQFKQAVAQIESAVMCQNL